MSGICGVIDCNNKLSTNEYLVKLSRDSNSHQKSIYSKTNSYNTFVGICVNNNDKNIENIIYRGVKYTCVFCGELYNADDLATKIKDELGYDPMEIKSFGAVAAWCYILWGGFSPKMLSGKFAYSIYSEGIFKTSQHTPKMFLSRDRFGFFPIYYCQTNDKEFVFSTSLGTILKTRKEKNYIENKGFWQILYLDGKSLPGYTLIKDIYELNAGCCAYLDCRDSCKIMIKSYDNYKNTPIYDTRFEKLLEESFKSRQINENTEKLIINSNIYAPEIIDESVNITHYPIFPYICESVKKTKEKSILYSNIGCELMSNNNSNIMRGFLPWIRDPYSNLDFVDNEKINFNKGFEFINSYRLNFVDSLSYMYYPESIYRFYLPMTLKHIEICADRYNISVKYPFCDNIIYSYLSQNREICDDNKYTAHNFEFEYKVNEEKIKESESAKALCEKLQMLIESSDSVINYFCNKNNLMDAIKSQTNIKALSLLYATHSFIEQFALDLYAL